MHRPCVLLTVAALLLFPALAAAGGPARIAPEEAGKIAAELEAKEKDIRGEYGNRANKEMSRDERKEMEAKLQAARSEVLEQHGASSKDYDVGMGRLGKDGRQGMQAAKAEHAKELEAAKAKKAAGDKGGAAPEAGKTGEIQVQRGLDEDAPATVTEQGVQVQRGPGKDGIEIPVTGEQAAGASGAAPGADTW